MDLRDQRTADHSEDVVRLARQVGELLSLDEPALVELEFAARLHDVGKIRVPDAVLNKPGPLNPQEREIMRCHAGVGRRDAHAASPASRSSPRSSASTTSAGTAPATPTGSPARCIPLASRIISVCDSFGAMTCDRPVPRRHARGAAIGELRAGAGTQFDPSVVDAFCDDPRVAARPR